MTDISMKTPSRSLSTRIRTIQHFFEAMQSLRLGDVQLVSQSMTPIMLPRVYLINFREKPIKVKPS